MKAWRRILVFAVCLAFLVPGGGAVLAASASPAPQAGGGNGSGSRVQEDLLWLMAGLAQMDKEPKLKVTGKQAGQILAALKPLVDKKLLSLDPPSDRAGQGAGPRGGNFQNATPQQQEQLRKRRAERQAEIQRALDAIDKILHPKQVEYLDNLDFDPTPYVVDRGMFASAGGTGTTPSAAQIEQLRAKMRGTLRKTAALNRRTYDLLTARAAGK